MTLEMAPLRCDCAEGPGFLTLSLKKPLAKNSAHIFMESSLIWFTIVTCPEIGWKNLVLHAIQGKHTTHEYLSNAKEEINRMQNIALHPRESTNLKIYSYIHICIYLIAKQNVFPSLPISKLLILLWNGDIKTEPSQK